MSDDNTETFSTGQASVEESMGYQAMPEAKPPEEDSFTSDTDGLKAAAKELGDQREAAERTEPPVERTYAANQGRGEEIPLDQTIKADRAARDLNAVRSAELRDAEQHNAAVLADAVDRARLEAMGFDINAQQAQPDIQAQPAEQPIEPIPGVDPDISRALQENPKLAQALAQEVQQVEQVKAQFAEGINEAGRIAMASLLSNFPELASLNAAQLPGAMDLIRQQNPQRHAQIQAHARQVQQLIDAAQAQKAQQAQIQQRQMAQYFDAEDAKFEQWAAKPENSQRVSHVKAEAIKLFESEYGISKSELAQLYNTQPLMRSAVGQQIVADALSFRAAMRSATANPARNVPPVQRPGVARSAPSGDNSAVRAAEDRFSRSGSPKDAARLLLARRAANR